MARSLFIGDSPYPGVVVALAMHAEGNQFPADSNHEPADSNHEPAESTGWWLVSAGSWLRSAVGLTFR
ncbi:hypothetical protein AAFP35_22890 [Gordonia sp. CPCC 206044]|uniref:hypothetical protein n=1 Tax=Gordonia sp. CPCC 206044 TaxID=3140793 RepID=UPI003AF3B65E